MFKITITPHGVNQAPMTLIAFSAVGVMRAMTACAKLLHDTYQVLGNTELVSEDDILVLRQVGSGRRIITLKAERHPQHISVFTRLKNFFKVIIV